MTKQEYIAVIGDIYDSRLLENREEVQRKLLDVLETINKKYQEEWVSKCSISMGDSFQGLLKMSSPFMQIIFDVELELFPVEFRFGIGIGEITTAIDPLNSQLNDGPAYHHARQAIEIIEKSEQQYATRKTNIYLSDQRERKEVELINAIFALNTAIKSKWSNRQTEIIKTYLNNHENQYKTAHVLDIGQSSVSKALKSTDFFAFKSSMEDLQTYINEMDGERE
ncbi:SatD family (SatD) [Atopostipes suicloacalis DSM 15692]|uniref:SatD family (SatD) n=1 Tax=Atopostipes suicloacalis DSM 15692 TaxID=1121025 RepID=A0A1M4XYL9_9LACT|nr:SatD family protein [Atopostipes suicloacalis]SHE98528.1 SatD family (SatD) [Atopostipes suicloacalis DSM 15692]